MFPTRLLLHIGNQTQNATSKVFGAETTILIEDGFILELLHSMCVFPGVINARTVFQVKRPSTTAGSVARSFVTAAVVSYVPHLNTGGDRNHKSAARGATTHMLSMSSLDICPSTDK